MALTDDAHRLIKQHLTTHEQPRALAVDATCGQGADTEFLLGLGFNTVLAFDVQAKAIELTGQRVQSLGAPNFERAKLIHDGHQNLENYLPKESKQRMAQCIMFNLGYLPTANKNQTTKADTTIIALNAAIQNLSTNGIISVMCYPGHPAGAIEKQAVTKWLTELNEDWQTELHEGAAPKPTAPVLYLVYRR